MHALQEFLFWDWYIETVCRKTRAWLRKKSLWSDPTVQCWLIVRYMKLFFETNSRLVNWISWLFRPVASHMQKRSMALRYDFVLTVYKDLLCEVRDRERFIRRILLPTIKWKSPNRREATLNSIDCGEYSYVKTAVLSIHTTQAHAFFLWPDWLLRGSSERHCTVSTSGQVREFDTCSPRWKKRRISHRSLLQVALC